MKLFIRQTMLLAIATSICACSSDELRELSTTKTTETPTKISLEDAVETAKSVISQMGPSTRSNELKVESVEYIGDMTRSGNDEDQACYYIVNFENESGFAILGADSRLEPVYAFSDEGNLSLTDTIENPGLKMYIDGLPKKIINTRIIIDPPTVRPNLKLNEIVKPMLSSFVRNWDQITYNKYVRQYCNNNPKTPVGCATVATAQVLSFFKQPTSIIYNDGNTTKKYEFDWEAINNGSSTAADQIARLFQILGSKDYLNATYSTTGLGTTIQFAEKFRTAYYRLGYNYPRVSVGFYETNAQTLIKNHQVIQLTGYSDKENSSHCWVVDGLASYTYESISNNGEMSTIYYYHFVWGNTNKNNGYYQYFNTATDGNFGSSSVNHPNDEPGGELGQKYKGINMYYNYTVRN